MEATNLSYTKGVMITFTGLAFGFVMWKTKQYKWWIMAGCVIRIVGYGVMFHIRSLVNPPAAELFVVQLIQGVGDGIVQTGGFVAATINVPHKETAQMAALVVLIGMLGQSVGEAISGAIYTGTFRQQLAKQLGDNATPELINTLFNSITGDIPAWGTSDRIAINKAVRPSLLPVRPHEPPTQVSTLNSSTRGAREADHFTACHSTTPSHPISSSQLWS